MKLVQTKISVLGHFGEGLNLLNGQTVKTKIITDELRRRFGAEQVFTIDTHGGRKVLLKAPVQVFSALRRGRNVLIFPAHNGLRVYAPLLFLQRRFFRGRKLHYIVIGGWLPEFLRTRRWLARVLRSFDFIYVETGTMKRALEGLGLPNVYVMPNCKDLQSLAGEDLDCPKEPPFKLCTFSRVMKEKGIEDAVKAVLHVNRSEGRDVFHLDIYGPVDNRQTEWFDSLKGEFGTAITYKGSIPPDKSTSVLQDYFALLFPTRFYTEGIPGTILDAYAAGVPVISAKWESFSDIVDDGETGIGYEPGSLEGFMQILGDVARHPEIIADKRINCLNKFKQYTPQMAMKALIDRI